MDGSTPGAVLGYSGVEERSVQVQAQGKPVRLARRPLGTELEEYHRQPVGQLENHHPARDWAVSNASGARRQDALGRHARADRKDPAGPMLEEGAGNARVVIGQSQVPRGPVGVDPWGAIRYQLRQHASGLVSLDKLRESGEDLSPVIRHQVRNGQGVVDRHGALRLSRSVPCPFALVPRKV